MELLRTCLAHHRIHVWVTACVVFASIGFDLAIPLLTGGAVDGAVQAAAHGGQLHAVNHTVAALAAVAAARFLFQGLRRFAAATLSLRVQHDLRVALLSRLHRLDGPAQSGLVTGQVVARAITDLSRTQALVAQLPMFVGHVGQLIVTIAIMAWVSLPLTALSVLLLPVIFVVGATSRKDVFSQSWAGQQAGADLAVHVEETVSGVRVVKAFAGEDAAVARCDALARRLYSAQVRLARTQARLQPILGHLPQLALVGTIGAGGWLAVSGVLSVGEFFAFSLYLSSMTSVARIVSSSLVRLQVALTSLGRLGEVLGLEPHVADRPRCAQAAATLASPTLGVELREVGVDGVFAGVSAAVAPGSSVAVVGPAGSGKTVLSDVLGGFVSPDSGSVWLVGNQGAVDVAQLSRAQLREVVTVVPDEPFLYSGSLRENIALATGATDAAIDEAVYLACADEFVAALPAGLDTVVGERGLTLSGGQRQRIALARALLARPKVLVLDDALSALDTPTEARVFARIRAGLPGLTLVAVAHRDSTRRACATELELLGRAVEHDLWPQQGPGRLLRYVPERDPKLDAADPASTGGVPFRLTRLLRPVAGLLAGVVCLLAVGVAADLCLPHLMRVAIDSGIAQHNGRLLAAISGCGVLVVAVSWLAETAQTVVTARAGERVLYGLRVRSFAHLMGLSMDYFEAHAGGRIMTRMTTDIDNLSSFLQTSLAQAVVSLTTIVGVVGMLAATDGQLAVVAVAAVPVIVVATVVFRAVVSRAYRAARAQISGVNAYFQEAVAGLRTAQMHGATEAAQAHLEAESMRYLRLRRRAYAAIALYFPGVHFISQFTAAAVLWVGAHRVAAGELSAGVLVAFVMYLGLLYGPVQQLGQIFDSWQQASVGLRRIAELLRTRATVVDTGDRPGAEQAARGEVALREVSFAYSPDSPTTVADLSVSIAPGTTVAVVGATGAGKSTLLKLLARFYDPTAGAVCAGDQDIREFPLRQWRRAIAQVPQEGYLFRGTVAANIGYAGASISSRADIEAAVTALGARDVIAAIPGGLNARVGERGRGLSAGQRQIIALARAQLAGGAVLLLDEATAALDATTEAAVLQASRTLAHARTCVVVAHRLETARRADRILVIEDGAIVEDGTHMDLLARSGRYARMWQSQ